MRKPRFLAKILAVCLVCSLAVNCVVPPKKSQAVAIGGAVAIGEVAMDIAVPLMMVYLLNQYGIVVIDGSDRQALVDFGRDKIVDFEAWLSQTETDSEYEKPKENDVDGWLKRGWLGGLEKVGNVYHYFVKWVETLVSDYQEPSETDDNVIKVVNTQRWIELRSAQLRSIYRTQSNISVGGRWGNYRWQRENGTYTWREYILTSGTDKPIKVSFNQYFNSGSYFELYSVDLDRYNYIGSSDNSSASAFNSNTVVVQSKVPLSDGRDLYVSKLGSYHGNSKDSVEFDGYNPIELELDYIYPMDGQDPSSVTQAIGEIVWYISHQLPIPSIMDAQPQAPVDISVDYKIDQRTLTIYNNYKTIENIQIYPKTGDKDVTVKIQPSGKYSDLLEPYTTSFGTVPIDINTGYTIFDGQPTVFAPLTFPDYQYSLPLIWKKFPFSILEDIGLLYDRLKAEPQAPHFELDVPLTDEPLVVDMTQWNDLAIAGRRLELLMIIVGLICVTMGFIGGGKND